jgi:hypothetical protein
MDRAFIEKNQIVERYLAGKLPLKGVQDFERFCSENPGLLDEIGLTDAVHRGVRLLEVGERSALEEPRPAWWLRPQVTGALAGAMLLAAILAWVQFQRAGELEAEVTTLGERLEVGALRAPSSTRPIRVVPERAPNNRIHLTVQRGERAELLELRVDVRFARLNTFRVTVDKKDQARIGTVYYVLRDSNGNVRLSVNTSSLHRGDYKVRLEGVTRRGDVVPVAWFNVRVAG